MADEIYQVNNVEASADAPAAPWSKLRKLLASTSGQALPSALAALGLGLLLIVPFLASISSKLLISREIDRNVKYYYAADAAIEYTLHHLKCTDLGEITGTRTISVPVGSLTIPITITNQGAEEGGNLVDAMLVMDVSWSMYDGDGDGSGGECDDIANGGDCDPWARVAPGAPYSCWGGSTCDTDFQPIADAKVAAEAFVDILEESSDAVNFHRVGLVSYSTSATLDYGLPSPPDYGPTDFDAVKTTIRAMTADLWTNIGDAIAAAAQELQDNGRPNAVKAIVLLSDGEANACTGCSPPPCESLCKQYAKVQAGTACTGTVGGINFFSIALGEDVDEDLMKYIARDDGCDPEKLAFYQESASSAKLRYKFESIAFYLTASKWDLTAATTGATVGGIKVEARAQVSRQLDRINIITWCIR
jgi:hypothetical protein